MVLLKIGNVYTEIEGLPQDKYFSLERKLSFRPQSYQFSTMYNTWIRNKEGRKVRRIWDGWKRQCWSNTKRTYFPTGLFSIAREFLEKHKLEYRCLDCRLIPDSTLNLSSSDAYKLRDYQSKSVATACELSRGIIQAATGSGKTIIGAAIIEQLNVSPFIFFVTSIDLLIQAKEELENYLIEKGSSLRVGQIGGGVIDIADVNVMTVQTAIRALGKKWDSKTKFDSDDEEDLTPIGERKEELSELIRTAAGAICDEVQHWRADTCQIISKELKLAYYRYGMSATPYRDEGDDLLIQACFGRKIVEITASQLIKEGYLVRPDINIINIRGEKSHFKTWQKIYKHRITDDQYYNNLVASLANGYIDDGRLVLVLVQQINHGKRLEQIIEGSHFLSGKSAKSKRKNGIDDLRNGKIRCIISTVIFDEGINIKPLNVVILAGQGKSKTRAMQRIGRITRPCKGKTSATAIDLRVHDKFLLKHSKEREKMYRTEPEYNITEHEA